MRTFSQHLRRGNVERESAPVCWWSVHVWLARFRSLGPFSARVPYLGA